MRALGLLVKTSYIEIEADSNLPICVLGDVGYFKGPRTDTVATAVAVGLPRHLPLIPSISFKHTNHKVEKTAKAMISFNGSRANLQEQRVKDRTDAGFRRYRKRHGKDGKGDQERLNEEQERIAPRWRSVL